MLAISGLLIIVMTQTNKQAKLPEVVLKPGMVITKSCKVKKAEMMLPSSDDDGKIGVITIKGNNINVDFSGCVLRGTPQTTRPDERKGTGLVVSGMNVTIKNLEIHGYKIGLIARNSFGIKIANCDLSYNWKQHLLSSLEREDESDWMSYHQNEKDEWLRYGMGIYLRNCDFFEVVDTRIVGGQNGLMIMESDKGKIWNNTFSFLSGCGLGMYRSSDNTIMHNKIDWCVRGYSHGVYNRGQDSAGIIIYEQSNKNTFAYNSVTHGGDGFFLWAGQSSMDTGKGGCNDNLLYGNDFSHAPTNGIEATFSKNSFVMNKVHECWHGIWGGYSYDTLIMGNDFADNDEGIAIEHGMNNTISDNKFSKDRLAINLWWNKPDPNFAYAKAKDTSSREYQINSNMFEDNKTVFSISDTESAHIRNNTYIGFEKLVNVHGNTAGMTFTENNLVALDKMPFDTKAPGFSTVLNDNYVQILGRADLPVRQAFPMHGHRQDIMTIAPKPLQGAKDPFIPIGALRGRKYILVDEWGPYDFKAPILWPRGNGQFEILGPRGTWKIANLKGVESISKKSGTVPDQIEIKLAPGKAVDVLIELEFTGDAIVSPFGVQSPAGKPYIFRYSKFFAPIDWDVKWFAYDKATQEPRNQYASFTKIFDGPPLAQMKTDKLEFPGNAPDPKVPTDYFATLAIGSFEVPAGDYELNVTSDDGVRVWVDGKKVIDNWAWHGPTLDKAQLKLGGHHTIRLEHFEIDGYSTLSAYLVPKRS